MVDVIAVIRRADQLVSARSPYEAQWQAVADYILPAREISRQSTPGGKRGPLIFNTTPVLACEHLAGALHGMLTSPALRWCKLVASDGELQARDAVRAWFEAATDHMYRIFTSARAGFDLALHETFLDVSAFGGGVMFTSDSGLRGPRYEAVPLVEIFLAADAWGIIDTLYRCYSLPAREVVRLWPKTVSEPTRRIVETAPDTAVDIIHATYPRAEGERGLPFATCWVEKRAKVALEEGGFMEFPFTVPRWSKRSGEVYGTGPGLSALPEVKKLNLLEELNLRGVAQAVNPSMLAPDDGFVSEIDATPGGWTYVRSGMDGDQIRPLITGARPDIGRQELAVIEARVQSMFYVDWMSLPTRPQMTATEVLQRRDEMLRLMGPMVSRLQTELLGPLIERTFNIMLRGGGFPPLPPELMGASWHVEYLGPLALAQKSSDAAGAMAWMQSIAGMASLDPNVVDIVDTMAMAEFLADRQGAPAKVIRAKEVIAELQAARAQRQQQAEMMAMAQQGARAAKDGAAAIGTMAGAAGAQPGV